MTRILQSMEDAVARSGSQFSGSADMRCRPSERNCFCRDWPSARLSSELRLPPDTTLFVAISKFAIRFGNFDDGRRVLVPYADVHRQAIGYLPIVLKEAAVISDANACAHVGSDRRMNPAIPAGNRQTDFQCLFGTAGSG